MNSVLHIKTVGLTYRGETRTGKEFNCLVIASADDGAGNLYRFLFDEYGNHAVNQPKAEALSQFFGIDFMTGKLDGEFCLVNIEKGKEYANDQQHPPSPVSEYTPIKTIN